MIAALEDAGIEVEQCHVTLWHSIQDRIETTTGGWKRPSFWWRAFQAYFKLIIRFIKVRDFDILMVGYPGQFDIFLAKFFALLRGKPLVWDVFMSIYLIAKERGLDLQDNSTVKLIRWIESRALRIPDMLIQDTDTYVHWFHEEYGISPERFRLVPTGADDRIFTPKVVSRIDNKSLVLYYGTFIPNHGVLKIMEAANFLRNEKDILFEFIGDGPDKAQAESFSIDHELENVRFLAWMSQEELLNHIAGADICLGAFGKTPQSLMTIQNKIYECMAMGKPVITGESPAVRAGLPSDTVVLCSRDDPQDIASAILKLKQDPARQNILSENAGSVFREHFSIASLGQRMAAYFSALVNK